MIQSEHSHRPSSSTAQSNYQAEQRVSLFLIVCVFDVIATILLPCMCHHFECIRSYIVRIFYKLASTYEAWIQLQLQSTCVHNYLSLIEEHLFGLPRWWQSNHCYNTMTCLLNHQGCWRKCMSQFA